MTATPFDLAALRERMSEGSFANGLALAEAGAVSLVAIEDEVVTAHVQGGDLYVVQLRPPADGGCTCPGDFSKAFGAGADFVSVHYLCIICDHMAIIMQLFYICSFILVCIDCINDNWLQLSQVVVYDQSNNIILPNGWYPHNMILYLHK